MGQGVGPGDVVITASYSSFDDRLMTVSGIDPTPTVLLQNLTLSHGKTSGANDVNSGGGAAIWLASGNLTLDSVVLTANHATFNGADADGGAIDETGGNLALDNVTLSSNVGFDGGAIADTGGGLTFTDVAFSSNSAASGGGLYVNLSDQTAQGTGSTFYANADGVGGNGGGILLDSGNLTLTARRSWATAPGRFPAGASTITAAP